jgi:GNAT superfamily N-acetyltransferase
VSEQPRIVEVVDEREPVAHSALSLIHDTFAPPDRQPLAEMLLELAERRHGMFSTYNYHLIIAQYDEAPEPAGAIIGVYLGGVNAGFIMYLAVRPAYRGKRIARLLRPALIEAFRADARAAGHEDVAWILGEVRARSPWLRRLVRTRGAIPFDLDYYHPGMSPGGPEHYILYRQPVADRRLELPTALVRRILYAVYRRAYRVRYPLQRPGFAAMIEELKEKRVIGVHPDFRSLMQDC